jgi:CcmD family protein
MNKIRKITGIVLFVLLTTIAHTQENVANPGNADLMRSNGKLYVVVAVVITILVGLFFYVFNLDRKISRMEKGVKS